MSIRFTRMAAAALPALVLVSMVAAQQTASEARQERRQERRENLRNATQPEQARGNDATIAMLLIPGNQEEIALAQLAERQSQNPQVKEFAQQMQKDHTQLMNQLRRFAGVAAGPAAPEAEPAAPTESTNRANQGVKVEANRRGAEIQAGETRIQAAPAEGAQAAIRRGPAVGFDFVQVSNQISQRALALTQQDLSQKQGAEFDKAYVGYQIGGHIWMTAKLEVLSDYASPQLREVLDQGLQTTKQHLQHARQLCQQLEQTAGQFNQRPQQAPTQQ